VVATLLCLLRFSDQAPESCFPILNLRRRPFSFECTTDCIPFCEARPLPTFSPRIAADILLQIATHPPTFFPPHLRDPVLAPRSTFRMHAFFDTSPPNAGPARQQFSLLSRQRLIPDDRDPSLLHVRLFNPLSVFFCVRLAGWLTPVR